MANITFNFDYSIPDNPSGLTTELGKHGSWTYNGPEHLLVGVIRENGRLSRTLPVDADISPNFKFQPMCETVKISAKNNPIIASLFFYNLTDNMPNKTNQTMPDGQIVEVNSPLMLDQVYHLDDVVYDFNTKIFNVPMHQNLKTWDDLREERNSLLVSSDRYMASDDVPTQLQERWRTYRQELRDITTTWANYHPSEVIWPQIPNSVSEDVVPDPV